MPNNNSLTPTELAFANSLARGVPSFNWIAPESPPLTVTVSQRSSYTRSLKDIGKELGKLNSPDPAGTPQKPELFNHVELDEHDHLQRDFEKAEEDLAQAKQSHAAADVINYQKNVRDAAKKKFDVADVPYQRLRMAFDRIVLRIGEACQELNQAVLAHSSALLTIADIEGDPRALLAGLVRPTSKLENYLWSRLAPDNQVQLLRLSQNADSADEIRSALANAINGVLQGAELFDRTLFTGTLPTLPDALINSDLLGVNRLLLQASYPGVRKVKRLDPTVYRRARENYIGLLKYLDTHELDPALGGFDPNGRFFPNIPNQNKFGYGQVLMWCHVDPVIEFSPSHQQNLITGITVVMEWKGYHTSSNGVPIPDK